MIHHTPRRPPVDRHGSRSAPRKPISVQGRAGKSSPGLADGLARALLLARLQRRIGMSRIAASETARLGPAAGGGAQSADGWRPQFRTPAIIPGMVLAA